MTDFKAYKVFENADSLAEYVGKIWRDLQREFTRKDLFFVSSPLSSTPLPLYQWIINHADSFEHWDKVRFILMDEQVEGDKEFTYVPRSDPASYERFAREKLLESLEKKIDGAITGSILKPDLRDLKAFDTFIEDHKGIDLLILAIGVKGHYAQVMPGTPIEKGFHVTKLIPELSAVHSQKGSKSYEGAKFREYGMSLGPKQVLGAKNIIVMITGESKIDLVKQLLSYKSFDPHFPLSIIHHPTVKPKIEVFLSKEVM